MEESPSHKMNFTPSQQSALQKFEQFLKGPEQVFILKGAAGTGKTTILKEMIRIAQGDKSFESTIALLAPTGRAAHVIKMKTGRPSSTIHKMIYGLQKFSASSLHSEDEQEDKTELRMHFKLEVSLHETGKVYFIDESSLISDVYSENEAFIFGSGYLLRDLFEHIRNNKIVLIGDPSQLPPVGMNISPALDMGYLHEHFGVSSVVSTLTEVVRQTDNSGILINARNIRNAIRENHFAQFHITDGNGVSVSKSIVDDFVNEAKAAISHSIVVTYRNKDARDYNVEIRRKLYGENVDRLQQGDLLIVSRNNYSNGELFNGSIVKVTDFEDHVICRTIQVPQKQKIKGKSIKKSIELRFRPVTISFLRDGAPFTANYLLLDNFLDCEEGQLDRNIAAALFLDFKIRHPNLKLNTQEFKEALISDGYYNALLCKYGYAITCHKAQGGEWDNVFVDMNRIGGKANENYFRWVYTAITRGARKMWHYNSPDFDVFSNLTVGPIIKGGSFTPYQSVVSDFKKARFDAVKAKANELGLECGEDLSANWQHRFIFKDTTGQSARLVLWFNSKGYSSKPIKVDNSSTPDFAEICKNCISAQASTEFIFDDKGRKSARLLHDYVSDLFKELDIRLMNVVNNDWQDAYHVLTEGQAVIEFWYNAKGQYTFMRPHSSLGEKDRLLVELCKRF